MDIPQTLREKLAAGRVIPFVGAGVSMAVCHKESNERIFPSWPKLLFHSADRLERESKQPHADYIRAGLKLPKPNFLGLASHAKDALGPIWATFLKEQFNHSSDSVRDESLALSRLIWQMGSRLIITTNYDKVLRWSCPRSGDCESWNIEHKAELAQFLGRQATEKPTVWHLHGSIEDASRIILTQDGYNLLYSNDNAKPLYAIGNEPSTSVAHSLVTTIQLLPPYSTMLVSPTECWATTKRPLNTNRRASKSSAHFLATTIPTRSIHSMALE